MENKLTKLTDVEEYLKEQTRFYISTPERLAEALVFVKKLKMFAEQVEESVKKRGAELMNEKNLSQIDFDGWRVIKQEASELDEYSVSSLFGAVGNEVAMGLTKVDNTKLKLWLKKSKIEGEMLAKINSGKRVKLRKGYIKIVEIKEKEKPIYIK